MDRAIFCSYHRAKPKLIPEGTMMKKMMPVLLMVLILVFSVAGCGGTSHLEQGGINATDLLNNLMDKTTRILSGVVNVDSAEAAKPQLEQVIEGFDKLIDEAGDLSPAARTQLSEDAARAMPGLKDNARRMNSKAGIDEILGPVMNEMVTKLSRLL